MIAATVSEKTSFSKFVKKTFYSTFYQCYYFVNRYACHHRNLVKSLHAHGCQQFQLGNVNDIFICIYEIPIGCKYHLLLHKTALGKTTYFFTFCTFSHHRNKTPRNTSRMEFILVELQVFNFLHYF